MRVELKMCQEFIVEKVFYHSDLIFGQAKNQIFGNGT